MCFWCGTEILKLRCSLLVRGSHQLRMFPGTATSLGVWTHLDSRSGLSVSQGFYFVVLVYQINWSASDATRRTTTGGIAKVPWWLQLEILSHCGVVLSHWAFGAGAERLAAWIGPVVVKVSCLGQWNNMIQMDDWSVHSASQCLTYIYIPGNPKSNFFWSLWLNPVKDSFFCHWSKKAVTGRKNGQI